MLFKIGVLQNFSNFTGKHLCRCRFFLHDIFSIKFYTISFLCKHIFYIGEKHTQWMLDTKVKVFHESISCFTKWPRNCISWNVLKEKFHSVSFPLEKRLTTLTVFLLNNPNLQLTIAFSQQVKYPIHKIGWEILILTVGKFNGLNPQSSWSWWNFYTNAEFMQFSNN